MGEGRQGGGKPKSRNRSNFLHLFFSNDKFAFLPLTELVVFLCFSKLGVFGIRGCAIHMPLAIEAAEAATASPAGAALPRGADRKNQLKTKRGNT